MSYDRGLLQSRQVCLEGSPWKTLIQSGKTPNRSTFCWIWYLLVPDVWWVISLMLYAQENMEATKISYVKQFCSLYPTSCSRRQRADSWWSMVRIIDEYVVPLSALQGLPTASPWIMSTKHIIQGFLCKVVSCVIFWYTVVNLLYNFICKSVGNFIFLFVCDF